MTRFRAVSLALLAFLLALVGVLPAAVSAGDDPRLTLNPTRGPQGTSVTATVNGVEREVTVTLFFDGKQVAQGDMRPSGPVGLAGALGIGRLVEGGFDSGGAVAWARIRKGAHAPHGLSSPPAKDADTLGLWVLEAKKEACEDLAGKSESARRVLAPRAKGPAKHDPARVKMVLGQALGRGDAKRGAPLEHVLRVLGQRIQA